MASMRDIKRRKVSVQSTQQITKAMKLVSTVKLQKARSRAEDSKAYFNCMYQTMTSLLAKAGNVNHPYVQSNGCTKKAVVVITSNRGLAGGYNSNVVKLITGGEFDKENTCIYAVGGKGLELLRHKGFEIVADYSEAIDEPAYVNAKLICDRLLKDFEEGKIGEIYVAYTFFKNTVSHIPTLIKVLPAEAEGSVEEEASAADKLTPMNFELEEEEAIALLVPKYISSILYGAFVEAVASENGARMQAMDSATSNAEEIISDLELKYNRARQGAITQELTEIIAGADAIG